MLLLPWIYLCLPPHGRTMLPVMFYVTYIAGWGQMLRAGQIPRTTAVMDTWTGISPTPTYDTTTESITPTLVAPGMATPSVEVPTKLNPQDQDKTGPIDIGTDSVRFEDKGVVDDGGTSLVADKAVTFHTPESNFYLASIEKSSYSDSIESNIAPTEIRSILHSSQEVLKSSESSISRSPAHSSAIQSTVLPQVQAHMPTRVIEVSTTVNRGHLVIINKTSETAPLPPTKNPSTSSSTDFIIDKLPTADSSSYIPKQTVLSTDDVKILKKSHKSSAVLTGTSESEPSPTTSGIASDFNSMTPSFPEMEIFSSQGVTDTSSMEFVSTQVLTSSQTYNALSQSVILSASQTHDISSSASDTMPVYLSKIVITPRSSSVIAVKPSVVPSIEVLPSSVVPSSVKQGTTGSTSTVVTELTTDRSITEGHVTTQNETNNLINESGYNASVGLSNSLTTTEMNDNQLTLEPTSMSNVEVSNVSMAYNSEMISTPESNHLTSDVSTTTKVELLTTDIMTSKNSVTSNDNTVAVGEDLTTTVRTTSKVMTTDVETTTESTTTSDTEPKNNTALYIEISPAADIQTTNLTSPKSELPTTVGILTTNGTTLNTEVTTTAGVLTSNRTAPNMKITMTTDNHTANESMSIIGITTTASVQTNVTASSTKKTTTTNTLSSNATPLYVIVTVIPSRRTTQPTANQSLSTVQAEVPTDAVTQIPVPPSTMPPSQATSTSKPVVPGEREDPVTLPDNVIEEGHKPNKLPFSKTVPVSTTKPPLVPYSTKTASPSTRYTPILDSNHVVLTTTLVPTDFTPELFIVVSLKTTWQYFCQKMQEFQTVMVKILEKEVLEELQSFQVKLLKEYLCKTRIQQGRRSAVIDVEFYITDKKGYYDFGLTQSFARIVDEQRLLLSKTAFSDKLVDARVHGGLVKEAAANYHKPSEEMSGKVLAIIIISSIAGACLLVTIILLLVVVRRRRGIKKMRYIYEPGQTSPDLHSLSESIQLTALSRIGEHGYINPGLDNSTHGTVKDYTSNPLNLAGLSHMLQDQEAMEEEFLMLPSNMPKLSDLPYGAEDKNRYANVIPNPETRVMLLKRNQEENSDYINANFIGGFAGEPRPYIATQAPLEHTTGDFWRMVWEQQSQVIIMLTDLEEHGMSKCVEYWPNTDGADTFRIYGDYQVLLQRRDARKEWVISTMLVKHMEKNLCREVHHCWLRAWPHQGVPDRGVVVVRFLEVIRPYIEDSHGPTVVHCSPGTGRTGTVMAIDIGLKSFDITGIVDILAIVTQIRRDRAGAVQTKEQYFFIYRTLYEYALRMTNPSMSSCASSVSHLVH